MSLLTRVRNLWRLSSVSVEKVSIDALGEHARNTLIVKSDRAAQAQKNPQMAQIIKARKVDPIDEIVNGKA